MLAILAALLVGQFEDSLEKRKVERFPPSPPMQRRILEAGIQAGWWARMEADHLYPAKLMLRKLPPGRHNRLNALKAEAKEALRMAAYRQVCEAYDIDMAQFRRIMNDLDVKLTPFTGEREPLPGAAPPGTIRMARHPWALSRPTRFDPDKVRLPERLARRHGYRNPGD